MKVFYFIVGISLILFSLVTCGVSLIAIIDPVEAQMADDNDPFGPSPSQLYWISVLCVFVAIGAAGFYLVRRSFRPHHDATNTTPRIP